jgi:hypothetical protein
MLIVGIDPGVKGALAIINTYCFKDTYAIPFEHNEVKDIYHYLAELKGGETYSRMERLGGSSRSKLKVVRSNLTPEKPQDTSMELWIEEPSVINIPNKGNDPEKAKLMGLMATKSLARNVGVWHGLSIALDTPATFINPRTWQSKLGTRTGGKKEITRNLAKKIFWHLTAKKGSDSITDSTADALLIALYGYIQYVPREKWPASAKENLPLR